MRPIKTLGDLSDFTESGALLTDIQGVGPGKAEKIADAAYEFHTQRKAA
jgi:hypothetical protein